MTTDHAEPRAAFHRTYPGSIVVEIVDGDSVRVALDLGFRLRSRRCRSATPSTGGPLDCEM